MVKAKAIETGASNAVICDHWAKGGEGAVDLANAVVEVCSLGKKDDFRYLYDVEWSIEKKIATIATEMYGASGIEFSDLAKKKIEVYNRQVIY